MFACYARRAVVSSGPQLNPLITMIGKPGKRKPIKLSFFFVPTVESLLTLDGISIRESLKEVGLEGLGRVVERGEAPTSRQMSSLAARMERPISRGLPQVRELIAALRGDREAQAKLDNMVPWEAFCQAVKQAPDNWIWLIGKHAAELERHAAPIQKTLHGGNFAHAADLAQSDVILRPYLSESGWEQLRRLTSRQDLVPIQACACLEFLVSQVALIDAALGINHSKAAGKRFESMVNLHDGRFIPAHGFIRDNMQRYEDRKLTELLERAISKKDGPANLQYDTLRNWDVGKTLPVMSKAVELFGAREEAFIRQTHPAATDQEKSKLMKKASQEFEVNFWAMNRLAYAHRIAERRLSVKTSSTQTTVAAILGSESADAWCQESYRRWLRHWVAERA